MLFPNGFFHVQADFPSFCPSPHYYCPPGKKTATYGHRHARRSTSTHVHGRVLAGRTPTSPSLRLSWTLGVVLTAFRRVPNARKLARQLQWDDGPIWDEPCAGHPTFEECAICLGKVGDDVFVTRQLPACQHLFTTMDFSTVFEYI